MGYVLGIDLGTSYSAAAIDEHGRTEIVQLGSRAAVIPSIVVLRADGEVLTGEAAERRSYSEPARTAREFKRRLGDPTPLILGGTPYGAESVMALLFKAIVGRVVDQRGELPELIAITHPASYGPYKLDLLAQAARQADIGETIFLSEPEAAAIHYSEQERVETGTVVAIYDFGGGTFDASVLRKTADGFELLGRPEGLERLGGIDFDEAIFQHVLASIRDQAQEFDPTSPDVQAALARMREECREAKEALSADTEAVIAVALPALHTDIRITRSEFESIVTPRVRETVAALERSVRSASMTMVDIDRILLVGGTSRIPMVGAIVREVTGRPVAMDAHPKHAVALGAAVVARRRQSETPGVVGQPAAPVIPLGEIAAQQPAPLAQASASSAQPAARAAVLLPEPIGAAGEATYPFTSAATETATDATSATPAPSSSSAAPGQLSPTPPPPPVSPGAQPQSAGGSPPARNRRVLAFGLVAVAAAIGLAAVLALTLGGSDAPDTASSAGETATSQPSTLEPTSPATAQVSATLPPVTSTQVPPTATNTVPLPTATPTLAPNTSRISSIVVAGGRYSVAFSVAGFTPDVTQQHVHFFFNTVPPLQAGVPGTGPWFVYGGGSPFTGYAVSERPTGATQMCILVARPDHSVIQGSGNCETLPN